MSGLLVLAIYLIGAFPAAVELARATSARGRCHHEDRRGGRDEFNHAHRSWCTKFHASTCWRAGEKVEPIDLKFTPAALLWPVLLIGFAILRQANRKPSRHALEAQIARLEREAGVSA